MHQIQAALILYCFEKHTLCCYSLTHFVLFLCTVSLLSFLSYTTVVQLLYSRRLAMNRLAVNACLVHVYTRCHDLPCSSLFPVFAKNWCCRTNSDSFLQEFPGYYCTHSQNVLLVDTLRLALRCLRLPFCFRKNHVEKHVDHAWHAHFT